MHDDFTVIGAFLDRERVDPDALVEALSSDEGRQYLVEVVMLREVTTDHTPATEPRMPLRGRRYPMWLTLAATITIGAAGGYVAGHQRGAGEGAATLTRPGIETGVISVVPVAPPPTRVITLEPGVNWHEEMGGG